MKRRFSGVAAKVVILILILCAAVSLVRLIHKLAAAQRTNEALEQQVLEAQAENDELEYAIEHAEDDEVISSYARDKLGMAYEDEQVFYGN